MKLSLTTEPAPSFWEDGFLDSKIEAQLSSSIEQARAGHLPRDYPPAPASPIQIAKQPQSTAVETVASSSLSQLIGGCGVAAIDGYLAMKEYATAKGLDLVELHHKGIDLQDLISTLIIHTQKMAESEMRQGGVKRYSR